MPTTLKNYLWGFLNHFKWLKTNPFLKLRMYKILWRLEQKICGAVTNPESNSLASMTLGFSSDLLQGFKENEKASMESARTS